MTWCLKTTRSSDLKPLRTALNTLTLSCHGQKNKAHVAAAAQIGLTVAVQCLNPSLLPFPANRRAIHERRSTPDNNGLAVISSAGPRPASSPETHDAQGTTLHPIGKAISYAKKNCSRGNVDKVSRNYYRAAVMRPTELRTPTSPDTTSVIDEAASLSLPDAAMPVFCTESETSANALCGMSTWTDEVKRAMTALDHIEAGTSVLSKVTKQITSQVVDGLRHSSASYAAYRQFLQVGLRRIELMTKWAADFKGRHNNPDDNIVRADQIINLASSSSEENAPWPM